MREFAPYVGEYTGGSRVRDRRGSGKAAGALAIAIALCATDAGAQYLQRRSVNTTGAITLTGNTLGLSKATNANAPGTGDSIGTFISVDTSLQDGTYPPGTTGDWHLDSSAATLDLPPNSTVVYAELVWGGSYSYGGEDVRAFLNTPVSLSTPAGLATVTPDPATARQLGTPLTNGRCSSGIPCFYVRSAEVTALVQAGGAGVYIAGGIPGTQGNSENDLNNAGWALAVIYENFSLPVRNLTIFTGAEQSGRPPAQASGFCTPPTGRLSGRLAVSAMEGDAAGVGDSMRFGATASLPDTSRVFGPNNPSNNFFCSQLNDSSGTLDTRGTFGTVNHRPGKSTFGGRQGWDITNVDVSPQLVNAQTSAFAQGTTSGDTYVITTLALEIDIGAPDLSGSTVAVDKAGTVVGDTLTYTITLPNSGTIDAGNGVLTAPLPAGTSLVANSVTVDGVPQAGADPAAGVTLGSLPAGQTRTVTFRVTVNAVPPPPGPATYVLEPLFSYTFVSCARQPVQSATFASGSVTTGIGRITESKVVDPPTATPGTSLTYTVTVSNDGAAAAAGVTLADPVPAGLTYVAGTTTLNGLAVPDVGGTMPFAAGGLVESPDAPAGQVAAGASAIVRFDAIVDVNAVGTIDNTASVDPDGGGPLAAIVAAVQSPVTPSADLVVTKSGPTTTTSNADVTYTIVVTNTGPSPAAGVMLDDPTPSGLSSMSATGGCAGFPCDLGALAAGASRRIDVTFHVPNGYTAPDPIVNQASVSSLTPDPAGTNNAAAAATSLSAPVAVLSLSKSNGGTSVVPGSQTDYTITLTNNGPNDSPAVSVSDPVPAGLANVAWTCSAGCSPASGSGAIATTVNLPAGATATLHLTGRVAADATGALTNTVTAQNSPGVGGTSSLTATDTDQLEPQADLSVSKSVFEFQLDPDTGLVTAVYDLVVHNGGPSAAAGVTVSDIPDAVQTFTSNEGDCSTAFPCNLGTIPPLQSRTIRSRFSVAPDFTGAAVTNQARVSTGTPDPTPGNDSSSVDAFPPRVADVAVEVFVQPDTALVGDTVTVFVRVSNLGPSTATSVVLTAPLPAGLEFVEATPDVGTFDQATGEWQVGDLPADPATPRVLRITARVTQPGRIAMLATKTGAIEFDPVVGNDSSGDLLNEGPERADVVVEKIATPASGAVGDVVLTGIIVTNAGPGPATGIVVSDLPTPGLLPVGILPGFPTQGTYDEAAKIWTVGDLAPQGSAALGILVQITDPSPQGNTARKESQNEPDPNPLNDRDGAPVNGGTASEITVTKAVSSERVRVGDQVTFTVKASNSALGPPVTGVVLTDLLPSGLTLLSATPSAGTFDSTGLVWNLGDLPGNGSATLALRVRVDQPGTFVNTATRTGGDQPEITPVNDGATATVIAGLGANVSVQKTIGSENAVPGLPATWTITVRNDGPSPLTGVAVADPVPAPLLSATWTCEAETGAACSQPSGSGDVATSIDLAAGTGVIFTVTGTVRPDALGTITNAVSVTPPQGADPDPGDNTATVESTLVPAADLSITKTGPTGAGPGATVTYAIAVSNGGPSTAVDVVVDDPNPDGLAFVSNAGDCTTPFPCSLGTLAPGESRTIMASYTVLDGVASVTNAATVASATLDPTPGNAAAAVTTVIMVRNTTTTTTTSSTAPTATSTPVTTTTIGVGAPPPPGPQADLALTKTASPGHVGVGETLTYMLVVTNAGPAPATSVTITDPLPGAVSFGSASATQGTCAASGATVACAVGDLAPGAAATATIVVTRTGSASFTNTAAASAAETDPTPQDGSSSATTPAAGTETCDNCIDDDGDGLIDGEDPDCCAAQPLTVTQARLRPGKSTLRLDTTLATGAFSGLDPRTQDVHLQLRSSSGEQVCCTIGSGEWQKLFRNTFGFYDQKRSVCPPVSCVRLALPKNRPPRATIIAGGVERDGLLSSMLEITMSSGKQCVSGQLGLRPKGKRGGVFP